MIFWSKKFSRWRFFRWLDLGRLENLATKNRENISKLSNQKKFKGVFLFILNDFWFSLSQQEDRNLLKVADLDSVKGHILCSPKPKRDYRWYRQSSENQTIFRLELERALFLWVSFGWRVSMGLGALGFELESSLRLRKLWFCVYKLQCLQHKTNFLKIWFHEPHWAFKKVGLIKCGLRFEPGTLGSGLGSFQPKSILLPPGRRFCALRCLVTKLKKEHSFTTFEQLTNWSVRKV